MSAKAISEQTGKEFLYKYICSSAAVQNRFRYANITPETDWDRLTQDHPWLLTEVSLLVTISPRQLVVKPDQLIKRRGKLGLVGINLDLQGVKEWLKGQLMKETTEAYIADLDAKSGASLKLTLLNPQGRIWTMVAGGGASVVYRAIKDYQGPLKEHEVSIFVRRGGPNYQEGLRVMGEVDHKQKFYWGHKEILLPVYKNMADAMKKHPEVDVMISFASLRSAYDSTLEAMQYPQVHTIAIIAEGIPEAQTRKLIKIADEKGVTIIGPATVGGIKPGCFKIGNTGGMLDNILASTLYRPGSVAYVSRSGGMSNELNNIISRTADGVYEGVAIGGDRYPGTTFMDHVLRYEDTPGIKMIVVLGEIGGTDEYKICQGIKEGRITKPVVCWCIGTCATMFASEVQFGHAGACANQASETAVAKNQALREAGAYVPKSFDELGDVIK
ncbi:hypothetical protein GOODEAATRI_012947 [Goodea atripinnis]|uniref:ATP-citrate synthase n=1 Tax=Goodea atripinnis TaxID=208336 RepID=A0ABV0P3P3_9TELE